MHDHDQPCAAELLLDRLIPALIRAGHISEDTLLSLASDVESEAVRMGAGATDERIHIATALRAWAIEAAGPRPSEWRAGNARKAIRLVQPE